MKSKLILVFNLVLVVFLLTGCNIGDAKNITKETEVNTVVQEWEESHFEGYNLLNFSSQGIILEEKFKKDDWRFGYISPEYLDLIDENDVLISNFEDEIKYIDMIKDNIIIGMNFERERPLEPPYIKRFEIKNKIFSFGDETATLNGVLSLNIKLEENLSVIKTQPIQIDLLNESRGWKIIFVGLGLLD